MKISIKFLEKCLIQLIICTKKSKLGRIILKALFDYYPYNCINLET